jgi:hypothetical protein
VGLTTALSVPRNGWVINGSLPTADGSAATAVRLPVGARQPPQGAGDHHGATKTLDVQEEEVGDPALVNAIVAAAQRGVTVHYVLENTGSKYHTQISQVEAAGAEQLWRRHGTGTVAVTGTPTGTPTTAGTNSVTVTATDSTGATASTTFSWTVNAVASGGGCTGAGQLLADPGFEDGTSDTAWTTSSSTLLNSDTTSEPAHTGSGDAWLGGTTSSTDTLAQTVAIPSGCTDYTFSFWLHTDTAETSTTKAYDKLSAQVLDSSGAVLGTLGTFTNLNANTGYAQQSYSLAGYAGKTVTLEFSGTNDYEDATSWVVDDAAVTVS